jgi:hypothetical protein
MTASSCGPGGRRSLVVRWPRTTRAGTWTSLRHSLARVRLPRPAVLFRFLPYILATRKVPSRLAAYEFFNTPIIAGQKALFRLTRRQPTHHHSRTWVRQTVLVLLVLLRRAAQREIDGLLRRWR